MQSTNVLIVDDEPEICPLIRDGLSVQGFRCVTATDPHRAKRLLDRHRFGVMVSDVLMPDISGLDLLAYSKQVSPRSRVILITGVPETQVLAEAIRFGAYDYFQKPLDMGELLEAVRRAADDPPTDRLPVRAAEAIHARTAVRRASLESIRALVRAVEAKDPFTRRHGEHVAHYAVQLARYVETPDRKVESIRIAALLHDVGKIGIPDSILAAGEPLAGEALEHIRRHPAVGAEILQSISIFSHEARLVRHHHENWDGSGYPDGLAGRDIPPGSRIIHLADAIDDMLMPRAYAGPRPVEQMLGELSRCSATQFDPELAAAAVEWCRDHPDRLVLPADASA